MARTRSKVFGLDLEGDQAVAAQAHVEDGLVVDRAVTLPLPDGAMRDGEVGDPEALAAALRPLVKEHGFPKKVRLGLANQRLAVRTLDLPPLTDRKELDAAVRFTAPDRIPLPLDQAVLDFQSLGIYDTPDGPRARVVVVAALREPIQRLVDGVRGAGLQPIGVDLNAFAMVRALPSSGPALIIHVGALLNLAVAEFGGCRFTRLAPAGLESLVGDLAVRRGLTAEHARGWLDHVGLSQPLDLMKGDPAILSDTRAVLEAGAARIADEVRNTLSYVRDDAGIAAEHVIVIGPGATIPGLGDALASLVGLPVAVGGPPGGSLPASAVAVAAGLSVEEVVS